MNMTMRSRPAGFTLLEGVIAMGIISTALIVGLALAISNLNAANVNSDRIIASHLAREGVEVMRNIRDSNWMRRGANIDKDNAATAAIQFYNSVLCNGAQNYWIDFFDGWPLFTVPAGDPCTTTTGYGKFFDIYLNPVPTTGYTYTNHMYTLHKVVTPTDGAAPDLVSCIQGNKETCRVKKKVSGSPAVTVYFQSANPPGAGESYTNFYRRIQIKDICHGTYNTGYNHLVSNDMTNNLTICPSDYWGQMDKIGELIISQVIWIRSGRILEVDVKERLYQWR